MLWGRKVRRWAAAGAVTFAVAVLFVRLLRPSKPRPEPEVPIPPFELEFAAVLTQFVVDINRQPGSERQVANVRASFGALCRNDADLIAAFDAVAASLLATASGQDSEAATLLSGRVNMLNDGLRNRSIPMLLYASALRQPDRPSRAVVLAYHVHQTLSFETPAGRVDVAVVRRLDRLNVGLAMLGYQLHGGGAPVLIREEQQQHVIDVLLPVLADARLPMPDDCDAAFCERVSRAMGRVLAVELARVARRRLGASRFSELRGLASSVARRRAIWMGWKKQFEPHLSFERLGTLALAPDTMDRIGRLMVPWGECHAFEELQERIDDLEDAPLLVEPLLELVSKSVARHEVQHYIDEAHPPNPSAGILSRHLSGLDPSALELSAYLAQLADDEAAPSLAWSTLASAVGSRRVGVASAAGALAIEALTNTPVVVDRRVDAARAAEALSRYLELAPHARCARARAAYREVFGRELPDVREIRPSRTWSVR